MRCSALSSPFSGSRRVFQPFAELLLSLLRLCEGAASLVMVEGGY
jgi:hypothetical protein